MFATQPLKHLPRRLRAARLYVRQTAVNPNDGFHAIKECLVRLCALHHQLGLPRYREHEGVAGLLTVVRTTARAHRHPPVVNQVLAG